GGIFSGAGVSGNSFVPSISGAGLHSVIYTYSISSQCSRADTIDVFVDVCTSIKELNGKSSILVYPNPIINDLIVTGTKEKGEIVIFDVIGKEIVRQKSTDTQTIINTEKLSTGF